MNLTGTIKVIKETQVVSEKFQKREFVLTDTTSMYPQDILIELHQDKVGLLDIFSVGDNVEVGINIRGREWINPQGEVKYFNTIAGWRISKIMDSVDRPMDTGDPRGMATKQESIMNEDDDLPF
jgi:hypothetical protein